MKTCKDKCNTLLWHIFDAKTKREIDIAQDMKDLIRGTIYSKPDKVIEAYKYFKKTPGIKIINIKEKIDDLNNITVNFIFEGKMIGEMQFQYQD